MKRILLMVIRNIFAVPYLWFRLCHYAKHTEKYTQQQHLKMLKDIVKRANKGGNVIIKSSGQENIPKNENFIFFPNHQGLYDVLAVVDTCPVPFSVVSKKEMAKVPFLKQVFTCMGVQFMDREDIRQSMRVIMSVAEEVKNGKNYLIFPEGTRSKKGNQLGEFKGGSFKAAVKAKCPIVPVALIDSFKPFDTKTTKQVEVQIHYLAPLSYDEYKNLKTTEIAEIVKKRIEKVIEKSR